METLYWVCHTAVISLLKNAQRHPLVLSAGNWVCESLNGFHSQIMWNTFQSFQTSKAKICILLLLLTFLCMVSVIFGSKRHWGTQQHSVTFADIFFFLLSCRCSTRWPVQQVQVRKCYSILLCSFYVFFGAVWLFCSLRGSITII